MADNAVVGNANMRRSNRINRPPTPGSPRLGCHFKKSKMEAKTVMTVVVHCRHHFKFSWYDRDKSTDKGESSSSSKIIKEKLIMSVVHINIYFSVFFTEPLRSEMKSMTSGSANAEGRTKDEDREAK
ncbi:uncharacterized protein G2W53_017664 [Senna tora]|uniref:Uncharacterized protein n=1 Tax=Senna tora TaxID=362788 RepID=A0A834TQQ6_9FABA|nr:uncharacterized protein G2W53_017664 [Senna tora]